MKPSARGHAISLILNLAWIQVMKLGKDSGSK